MTGVQTCALPIWDAAVAAFKTSLLGSIYKIFESGSPSRTMTKVGSWLASSVVHGFDASKLSDTLRGRIASMTSGVGSSAAQWAGTVAQALSMTGHPMSWMPGILARLQQESGGNAMAINNWDINAARGDPSRGLMQTIGSTFGEIGRASCRERV